MVDNDVLDVVKSIDQKLNALLAVEVARLQAEDPSLTESRHPSVESILAAAGMTQTAIAQLLGKSVQAVSQRLAKEKEVRAKS